MKNFIKDKDKSKSKKTALLLPLAFLSLLTFSCSTSDVSAWMSSLGRNKGTGDPFTNTEAISAMKDALIVGITSSSKTLSATDGYFGNALLKIILPPEAATLISYIDKIPGGQTLVNDVVLRLNRSAEAAAKEVVPIFSDAITSMTVADGIEIVCGANDAATNYLREKTYDNLVNLYRPKVSKALSQPLVLGISANTAWTELVTKYNQVAEPVNMVATIARQTPPMPKIEVDLATYATQKALDGLFMKVAEEEKEIRANPLEYASAMIKKVFGAVKAGFTRS